MAARVPGKRRNHRHARLTDPHACNDNAGMKSYRTASGKLAATLIVTVAAATIFFGLRFSSAQTNSSQKGISMPAHASGPFDVKLAPQDDKVGDPTIGRMSIDKQFHGDLEGTSKGQMLTAMTEVKGSAGYVAIERVTGTLRTSKGERNGSFALLHRGIMTRGAPELSVTVVPDSGTGQLAGLTGTMTIHIVDGKHSYDFDYTLPE
jgi:hypothetical protein